MKKSMILTVLVSLLALWVGAETVTRDMAITAANAWAARNGVFGAKGSAGNVLTVCDTNAAQTVLWHQVSMSNGGCLFIAPCTEVEPVLVALERDPGELPAAHPLRGILSGDVRKRLRFLGLYTEDSSGAALQGVRPGAAPATPVVSETAKKWGEQQVSKWSRLGVGAGAALQAASSTAGLDTVPTVVKVADGFEQDGRYTHWTQDNGGGGYCYNYYTPYHSVCGCVATATAALVQFFAATNGVKEYVNTTCTYNGYSCAGYEWFDYKAARTKGGTYDWSLFDKCTSRSDYNKLSPEQRELLGRVAFDAGVGVGMHWTAGSSGAVEANIVTALKEVFGFKNARYIDVANPSSPADATLRKLIYGQCAAGYPVGMGIEGHSVLAVGYGLDGDDVERVRVFMGWAGSGDGWYALPRVDCTAVVGGSSYLSTIVDGIVTMISYDDDDIVPVVGQVNMPGVALTFEDATGSITNELGEVTGYGPRVVPTDENGYFATRVPPATGTHRITCAGKSAAYEIGAAAKSSTSESALQVALPDWLVPLTLLNATVAYSYDEAIELALKEGKAIFTVSGISSASNTMDVLNFIYDIDDANVNDFTNRFVYFFQSYTSSPTTTKIGGDGAPSFSIVLPQETLTEDRWLAGNGRLAYGTVRNVITNYLGNVTNLVDEVMTNDVGGVQTVTTNQVEVVETNATIAITNVLVSTYAPSGTATPTYQYARRSATEFAEAQLNITNSVATVLEVGWTEYLRKTQGIALTILTDTATNAYPTATTNFVRDVNAFPLTSVPMAVTYTGFTNGQQIVCSANYEETNTTTGVVIGLGGWRLLNETTGELTAGEGTKLALTLATNDVYTLTWTTTTNAVWIGLETPLVGTSASPRSEAGTYNLPSGWYPYGKRVLFEALPSEKYWFSSWNSATGSALPDDGVTVAGPLVEVYPTVSFSMRATFVQRSTSLKTQMAQTNKLSVVSYLYVYEFDEESGAETEEVRTLAGNIPDTIVFGDHELAVTNFPNGTTNDLRNMPVGLTPAKDLWYDDEGRALACNYWFLFPTNVEVTAENILDLITEEQYLSAGSGAAAGITLGEDAQLVWFWTETDAEPEPIELKVEWNKDLNNLHTGANILMTADEVAELSAEELANLTINREVPEGWLLGSVTYDADFNIVAMLTLDETTLQPKPVEPSTSVISIAANGDTTYTVSAAISNAVLGFWYSFYEADEVTGPWTFVKSSVYTGEAKKQMNYSEKRGDAFTFQMTVTEDKAKKFYKLVVTEKDPSLAE